MKAMLLVWALVLFLVAACSSAPKVYRNCKQVADDEEVFVCDVY